MSECLLCTMHSAKVLHMLYFMSHHNNYEVDTNFQVQ